MFVAKVTGSLVSTQKTAAMVGHKLLVVEPYRLDPKTRDALVTTDTLPGPVAPLQCPGWTLPDPSPTA